MGIILKYNQHFKFIAKTILLHVIFLFCISTLYAQDTSFEQTVQFIKKKFPAAQYHLLHQQKGKLTALLLQKMETLLSLIPTKG